MKGTFDLNIMGKYWKDDSWRARIESLELEVTGPSPYRTLLKMVEAIEIQEGNEDFRCSISLLDSGIFYLKLRTIVSKPS